MKETVIISSAIALNRQPKGGVEMGKPDDTDRTTAGTAALSICESLLIALNDLKIIDDKQTRGVLEDAAATHRNAIPLSANPDEHRVVAALIERLMVVGSWVRKAEYIG